MSEAQPANTRGEVTIVLDGADCFLRPSHEAIEVIEDETARSLAELTNFANKQALSIATLAIIATETMKAWGRANPEDPRSIGHAGANRKRVAELIYEAGTIAVQPRIAVLLIAALTGQVTASGEMKPVATKTTGLAAGNAA